MRVRSDVAAQLARRPFVALDRRNRGVFSCGNSALPAALKPFNQLWLKIGLLLHKMVNPIMTALVFFGAVMPTGLIMRALRKDLLRQKWQPDANSYWIERWAPQ